MTNSEDSKTKSKLRGQENYIEWFKRFQILTKIKKWGSIQDGKFNPTSVDTENDAFEWVLNNIADEATQPLRNDKNLAENLKLLNDTFGYGRLKPIAQEQTILDFVEFSVTRNPIQVFLWLDKQFDILKACGGSIDEVFLRRVITAGLSCTLNPTAVYDAGDFWFVLRGGLNSLKKFEYEDIKTLLYDYWDAHRNKMIPIDEGVFQPLKRLAKEPSPTGNQVSSNEYCSYCLKHRKKKYSHEAKDCRFGDKPGWNKSSASEAIESNDNKPVSPYSC
jgi:hypothetical protein